MSVLLFTDQLFDGYSRLERAIWNSGHFIFFALSVWFLLTHFKLKKYNWKNMLGISLLFSFLMGSSIELIQYFIGRDMDRGDLIADISGGFFGFLLVSSTCLNAKKYQIRRYIYIAMGGLFFIGFYPVIYILQDNFRMQSNFPILADFESSDELQRWDYTNIVDFRISDNKVTRGNHSLYVEFGLAQYPQISLQHFPSNWSKYDFLNIDIYNIQKNTINIVLKIYDRLHRDRGSNLSDRYNQVFNLKPGWNKLRVSLDDIQHAPASRLMDVNDIALVSLFLIAPEVNVSFYIDDIHLLADHD